MFNRLMAFRVLILPRLRHDPVRGELFGTVDAISMLTQTGGNRIIDTTANINGASENDVLDAHSGVAAQVLQ